MSEVCRKHQIPLFMDGARLGYGVMSDATDVDITDIAKYCDIFISVAQKLVHCGEAIVFTQYNEPKHFTTRIKQHGALLAKGRLVGIQF